MNKRKKEAEEKATQEAFELAGQRAQEIKPSDVKNIIDILLQK